MSLARRTLLGGLLLPGLGRLALAADPDAAAPIHRPGSSPLPE